VFKFLDRRRGEQTGRFIFGAVADLAVSGKEATYTAVPYRLVYLQAHRNLIPWQVQFKRPLLPYTLGERLTGIYRDLHET